MTTTEKWRQTVREMAEADTALVRAHYAHRDAVAALDAARARADAASDRVREMIQERRLSGEENE